MWLLEMSCSQPCEWDSILGREHNMSPSSFEVNYEIYYIIRITNEYKGQVALVGHMGHSLCYVHRCHIIDEHKLYLLPPMNITN
jgi:hypothetical protein